VAWLGLHKHPLVTIYSRGSSVIDRETAQWPHRVPMGLQGVGLNTLRGQLDVGSAHRHRKGRGSAGLHHGRWITPQNRCTFAPDTVLTTTWNR